MAGDKGNRAEKKQDDRYGGPRLGTTGAPTPWTPAKLARARSLSFSATLSRIVRTIRPEADWSSCSVGDQRRPPADSPARARPVAAAGVQLLDDLHHVASPSRRAVRSISSRWSCGLENDSRRAP